jgi:heme-degrading monooxygenase HmoA
MHARVSTFEGPPARTTEGIRMARERILPVARLLDGFLGIHILFDRESGRSLTITLWRDEESMQLSEDAARRVKEESARVSGDEVTSVERYEVALSELFGNVQGSGGNVDR